MIKGNETYLLALNKSSLGCTPPVRVWVEHQVTFRAFSVPSKEFNMGRSSRLKTPNSVVRKVKSKWDQKSKVVRLLPVLFRRRLFMSQFWLQYLTVEWLHWHSDGSFGMELYNTTLRRVSRAQHMRNKSYYWCCYW